MRILILTSCTGEKAVTHDWALDRHDFARGPDWVARREQELAAWLRPAEQLYRGQQHVRLLRGIRALRAAGGAEVDLRIVSAGYGLVRGDRPLAPYECSFNELTVPDRRQWAQRLRLPEDAAAVLATPYELGLILLGDAYLAAVAFEQLRTLGGPTVLFCGARAAARLPSLPGLRIVRLGNPDARRHSVPLVALKGELAARLLERLVAEPGLLPRLADPDVPFVEPSTPAPATSRPTARPPKRAKPEVDRVIALPPAWLERPHRERMRYFIPDWDDLVDPDYDFLTDTHSGGTGDWTNQVYAHQLFPEPNADGILISRVVAEQNRVKRNRIEQLGVHRFLRVPREFPVMGDCGAFGYIKAQVPPYQTVEIVDYYSRLGFDYGVSIDHIIFAETEAQKLERYQLTIGNAADFLEEHRRRGERWTPVGAVQGWDPASYRDAARQYVAMGYRYLALGGLVRSSTAAILAILAEVHRVVPPTVAIHLFGLARLQGLAQFAALGVRSVDSVSFLRQAWMRTATSYAVPGGAYAALRIPEAGKSFRAKRMAEHPGLDEARIRTLEQAALRGVRGYAARECSLDACLNALLEYDRFVTTDRIDMAALYRRTLADRPWEQCPCAICRRWGVEVAIFRGNNRNRRRGFHNTYVFYRLFQEALRRPDAPAAS